MTYNTKPPEYSLLSVEAFGETFFFKADFNKACCLIEQLNENSDKWFYTGYKVKDFPHLFRHDHEAAAKEIIMDKLRGKIPEGACPDDIDILVIDLEDDCI